MVSQRYFWLTLAELEKKCEQRGVSSEGTKAQLRQRLINWDEMNTEEMKEFVDLPPEIRKMIYTHCENQAVDPAGKEWGSSWNKHNHGMVYQPPIFQTCRTIRSEGLLAYYERQPFTFGIHYESDLWKVFDWMERIGDAPRLHIRDITITLVPTWLDFSSKPLLWIHVGLSDAATVRYEGPDDFVRSIWSFFAMLTWRHFDPACRPNFQHSAPGRLVLTFPPGQGWFGPRCKAKALRMGSKL